MIGLLKVFPALVLAALLVLSAAHAAPPVTVEVSEPSAPAKRYSLACGPGSEPARECLRVADFAPASNERCLQIWGGPSRAVISSPTTRERTTVTRANSCEIGRWKKLQARLN